MSNKYKEAGVNLEAGYESVRRIKSHVERTKVKGMMNSLGAFGGMFDLSLLNIKEPVLVSGTDGVGTKLMIAFEMDKHDTIGIDAVAMCVNDIIVQGAKPLYFLDYIAVGKNDPKQIEDIVKGIADGCVSGNCSLIGGETAGMPGMYQSGHYDIAGFAVGVVEKSKLITGEKVKEGDTLIGLTSSGVHSNGFSLLRKIIKDNNISLNKKYAGFTESFGDTILTPTKIYVETVLKVLDSIDVHGMSHVTGGGFYENIPRVLSEGLKARIDIGNIELPEIFKFLGEKGNIPKEELYNVFNMGIGFMMIVAKEDIEKTLELLNLSGEKGVLIGEIEEGAGVDLKW